MVNVNSVALSGVYAAEQRLAVAADNIANANTNGFKSKEIAQFSNPQGGVTTRVVAPSSTSPANDEAGEVPSNVSLEKEILETKFATYGAQANLKVLQVQKNIDNALLDIQA